MASETRLAHYYVNPSALNPPDDRAERALAFVQELQTLCNQGFQPVYHVIGGSSSNLVYSVHLERKLPEEPSINEPDEDLKVTLAVAPPPAEARQKEFVEPSQVPDGEAD